MRVSYDWLKTMIDIPEDPKTLSDEYIRTGTEVEAIDTVGESFDHRGDRPGAHQDPAPR